MIGVERKSYLTQKRIEEEEKTRREKHQLSTKCHSVLRHSGFGQFFLEKNWWPYDLYSDWWQSLTTDLSVLVTARDDQSHRDE